jgi:vacuolar-type H+-ATPase subunit I/STV1
MSKFSGKLSYKDWCIIKHSLELKVSVSQDVMQAVDYAIRNLNESKYTVEKVKKQRKELEEEKSALSKVIEIVDEIKESIGR